MILNDVRIWVLATLVLLQAPALAFQGVSGNIPDEIQQEAAKSYIFVFTEDVDVGDLRRLAQDFASDEGGSVRHVFSKALKGFSANVSPQGAARIARMPQIAYYEPNRVMWAFDRVAPRQEGAKYQERPDSGVEGKGPGNPDDEEQPPQVVPWGIARVGGPQDGAGLHAWIIDSGIDLEHPDLNVGYGANFVTTGGSDSPDDDHGHGTHVAGTVGAIDNDIGVVGVAANATVHPVKVLSRSGFGMTDWIVAGVDFVAANATVGDTANMSLGGPGHQQSIHDAVVNAAGLGVRFSIAAGNESDDAELYEPAHVEHENVYTVSAIDEWDVFASFSNWGNPPVDYAAPGVSILSTEADGTVTIMHGTSMAAPHVGGLLLKQAGDPAVDGYAIGDPDGTPDPIAHYY